MKLNRLILFSLLPLAALSCAEDEVQVVNNPVDYVTTLMGTLSDYSFSTGNTYPATAVPWGMNFWTPQTGTMGDGWTYSFDAHLIRGLKQTHQPSPWINDYGCFSIMPVRDASKVTEDARASWFSHKGETATPYYYQVYLADHDINAELTPSDRAAKFRFTFPDSETSGVVVDAYDRGSYIKIQWSDILSETAAECLRISATGLSSSSTSLSRVSASMTGRRKCPRGLPLQRNTKVTMPSLWSSSVQ